MLFNMLMDVLREIYQSQLEMLELANRKKQVLIEGNVKELSNIIKLESNWVKRVGKLEEERINIVQQILHERNIPMSEATTSDLIKILTSPTEKEDLENIIIKLSDVIKKIQHLNELNTSLVQQSLDYISRMFSIITEETNSPYVYSNPSQNNYSNPKQKMGVNQRRSIFDQKA